MSTPANWCPTSTSPVCAISTTTTTTQNPDNDNDNNYNHIRDYVQWSRIVRSRVAQCKNHRILCQRQQQSSPATSGLNKITDFQPGGSSNIDVRCVADAAAWWHHISIASDSNRPCKERRVALETLQLFSQVARSVAKTQEKSNEEKVTEEPAKAKVGSKESSLREQPTQLVAHTNGANDCMLPGDQQQQPLSTITDHLDQKQQSDSTSLTSQSNAAPEIAPAREQHGSTNQHEPSIPLATLATKAKKRPHEQVLKESVQVTPTTTPARTPTAPLTTSESTKAAPVAKPPQASPPRTNVNRINPQFTSPLSLHGPLLSPRDKAKVGKPVVTTDRGWMVTRDDAKSTLCPAGSSQVAHKLAHPARSSSSHMAHKRMTTQHSDNNGSRYHDNNGTKNYATRWNRTHDEPDRRRHRSRLHRDCIDHYSDDDHQPKRACRRRLSFEQNAPCNEKNRSRRRQTRLDRGSSSTQTTWQQKHGKKKVVETRCSPSALSSPPQPHPATMKDQCWTTRIDAPLTAKR